MKHWKLNAFAVAIALNYPIQAMAAESEQNQEEKTEVIEVRGVQYSDQKARLIERDKKQFSSVVSTDDLGNFVDQNVAESLRRMPGITLQRSEGEGKFVTLRGLGPEFVSVSMNGSQMAGIGDERKMGLDSLSGDTLGSIEVYKTLTPDLNLNAIGGVVNVNAISAYERGKDTLKLKIQDSYSELREEHSPKFTIDGTQFLFDKKVGIGFAASHEKRATVVNEHRHHSTNIMQEYTQNYSGLEGSPSILGPQEYEIRQEQADRTRNTGTLNVEFKPDDANMFYVRGNYSEFTDEDVAYREFYRFLSGGGGADEILYVNEDTQEFVISDADLQHQFFIQESTKETTTFNIGGKHQIGDAWTVEYDFTTSKAVEDATGDRRVQFRERDLILYGKASKDMIDAKIMSPEETAEFIGLDYTESMFGNGARGDINDPANMEFDNVFLEGSTRTDEIKTFNLDVQYDFIDSDWLYYLKAGIATSNRDHITDKNRWSYVPETSYCNEGDQTCIDAIGANHANIVTDFGFDLAIPENSDFQYPFVSRDALNYLVDSIEYTKDVATAGKEGYVSLSNDYQLIEDTREGYVMGEMELAERVTMITGVRWVETEYASTGYMTIRNDRFTFGNSAIDVFQPLPQSSIKYSEFFPSVHVRYEPTDTLLIRGAVWTSYSRPSFKDSRSFAKMDDRLMLCSPTSTDANPDCYDDPDDFANYSALDLQDYTLAPGNSIDIGNPNLIPMTSTNYDASVSWYHSEDLFMELSVFYKDIKDFIVETRGISGSFDTLPITLPINQVTEFIIPQEQTLSNINMTINGDYAEVYGFEVSYNQFFDSGFFIQSNATIQTSEARVDPTVRKGTIALPEQADTTANLTFGWENDDFNVRLIGNYRSDILEQIGACPEDQNAECRDWSDQYQSGLKTLDFKMKYDFGAGLSAYFDAINLTDNKDLRYFEGNAASGGNVLYQREEYGRTIQVGLNYKFY
ncbi:TonB-dependent receptor [Catenovulum sp. 2E275]|uniref:TonB-dependent receptor n=1 Tax=Catenovulum sp. 2E275 TaxID=2980497 RepID=UPI0021D17998|nr:TonB-dependent receptor [Catenovulum sp. 2E275]MCU4677385.1 TonB-dependent receptor [Catenovulum sp. 2E275]